MHEIASIMKLVLSTVRPDTIKQGAKKGQKSLAKFTLDQQVATQARKRIKGLLDRFPLYPEIDVDLV
jgi:glycine hydroxymethyltransferase